MKIIVIGTSLTGKTTIIRYLRQHTSIKVSEIDELLTEYNGGEYPIDAQYKHEILAPKIIQTVLNAKEMLFFTNTDYFTLEDLEQAHKNGFLIVQLELSESELIERNNKRMREENYSDMSIWLKGMLEYQHTIKDAGLVNYVIMANQETKNIVNQLLELTQNKE